MANASARINGLSLNPHRTVGKPGKCLEQPTYRPSCQSFPKAYDSGMKHENFIAAGNSEFQCSEQADGLNVQAVFQVAYFYRAAMGFWYNRPVCPAAPK
ncbi:MAG: hypothetical protein ACFNLT_10555 [Eikenella halliae]